MFSDALRQMDHNTELYMIEELHNELSSAKEELSSAKTKLSSTEAELAQANSRVRELERLLAEKS